MKKLLICLLALCLLVPFFSACNKGVYGDKTVQRDETLTVEPVDLGGDTITVLCKNFGAGSKSILGYTGEIIYDEENPSTVDEAKREVVEYMEGIYNCEIEGRIIGTEENIYDIISSQISANLRDYDIYFDSLAASASIASSGCALDLKTVPNINVKDEWWDQNAVQDLSINGKLYFICGDINTYDDQGTFCVLFNKTLKETLTSVKDVDFYELASSGKWTFDKFKEICAESQATVDLNGDGQDEKDQWAFGTELFNIYAHVVGSGYKIAQKNNADEPYLTVATEKTGTYKALQSVMDFYKSKDVMVADTAVMKAKYPNDTCWDETVHKSFVEGRELFYMGGLFNVASFRQMDDVFGILPVPKGSLTQDRYYHTVSKDNASVMFLPVTHSTEQLNDIGTLISAISEYSMHLVTPAYYDVQLKYRDSRDDESGEMLDLIFDSRTFDLGSAYGWGGILGQYMLLDKNVASRFETNLSKAETELQDMLESLNFQ